MLKLYISRGEENPVVEAIEITDWEIMSLIHRYFYYEARYPNMVKSMRNDAIAKGEQDSAEFKKQTRRNVLENRAKEKAVMVAPIRCQDCKYYNAETKGCKRNPCVEPWNEEDYCSFAEER